MSSAGVTVGGSSTDAATLKLEGSLLTSESGDIGSGAGTNGSVTVGDANSSWLMSASLIVGNNGTGNLTVKNGGRVTTGGLVIANTATGNGSVKVEGSLSTLENGFTVVGDRGTGSLEIDNASLKSERAEIGSSQGATGTVTVKGATGFGNWTLTSGDLIVGSSGNGTLTVSDGNRVDVQAGDLIIAEDSGASGAVTVSGSRSANSPNLVANHINIGATGSLTIETGAVVESRSTGNKQLKGLSVAGKLKILDGGTVLVGLDAVLASNPPAPIASVDLEGKAEFQVLSMTIGDEAGTARGQASGTIKGAFRPKLFGNLFTVYSEGKILSRLTIVGTVDLKGGTVALGTGTPNPKQGVETEPSILIEGDLIVDAGTIEVEVAGLSDGQYGRLEVTGSADLMDATLVFQFMDGFLPQTGDAIPFISATGGLTSSNLSLQFDGVAEGFDFTINEDNQMLMFEALNDAQAVPSVGGVGCAANGARAGNPASTLLPLLVTVLLLGFFRFRRHV